MCRQWIKPVLALLITALPVSLWAADDAVGAASAASPTAEAPSNRQSWQEDDRENRWTWFGMGYESRRSFSEAGGAAAAGGGGGGKTPGAGGGGSGGGRR